MDITVAVCTHDRAVYLADVVAAIRADRGRLDVEVLVIDSASPSPVGSLGDDVRVVRLDVPGISLARNTALREARAEVVAFVDDDGRPRPGWLAALLRGFDAGGDVAAVGGPIALQWPDGGPPAWVSPRLAGWFSALDLGSAARDLDDRAFLYCTNLAFRRRVTLEVGGFAEALQREPGRLMSGGEVHLQRSLRRAGARVRYEPGAVVDHIVLPDRISRRWVLRRAYWQGRGEAVADRLVRGHVSPRRLAAHAVHRALTDARHAAWMDFASTRSAAVGYLVESVLGRRNPNPKPV
jgi:glycosyltransferase involved in cell wall biosynthesis